MIVLNRIKSSLTYRLAYQVSPILSRLLSSLNQGEYGHGTKLTQARPLLDLAIPVEDIEFDIEDCWRFWDTLSAQSTRIHELVSQSYFWQKISQYYFSYQCIKTILANPDSVYIDIAATDRSPYQEIINLLSKTHNTYIQDLIFPSGIDGNRIGGSAANIPLPDASVDAMTLHCAFEHFEGNADTDFVREAGRLLRPGGKVCIVPLYLGEYAFVLCDPAWAFNLSIDQGAVKQFFPRWGERHGRFYSPKTLLQRIIDPSKEVGLLPRVIHFTNILELDSSCYTHFALILEKL